MMLAVLADIPLELVLVDLMKGEQHSPAFARLNPNRLVPVLEDGDFVLTESSAIMKYLADHADSALYPKDLKRRAQVNERMDWFNTNLYRDWGYNLIYPQVFSHHARACEEHTQSTVEWGRAKSLHALAVLDEHIIRTNAYVCGDALTIADLFGAQILSLGELVRADLSRFRNVHRWLERMKSLPAWQQVNQAHEGFARSLAGRSLVAV